MSCGYSTVNETLICFICGDKFELGDKFKEHLSTHLKTSENHLCGLETIKAYHLETEKYNSNGNQFSFKESFQPNEINLTFCDNFKYKEIHVCSTCGKEFKRKDHLQKHSVIHTSIKPFPCLVCGKKFARKDRLKEHCVIHLANGWSCYFCGKMFSQRCILRKHEMIHRGVKPFSCELCDMKFSRKNDLMRHSTTHTGEKNHLCDICGKGFSQRRLVKRHLNIHKRDRNMEIIVVE